MCALHFNAMTHVAQAATLKHFWGWDIVSAGQQRSCCMVRNKRPLCASLVNTTVFSCLTLTKTNSPSWKGIYQLCWCKHLWWCLVIHLMIFHWIIWKLINEMLLNRCFLYFCFKTWNQTRKQDKCLSINVFAPHSLFFCLLELGSRLRGLYIRQQGNIFIWWVCGIDIEKGEVKLASRSL